MIARALEPSSELHTAEQWYPGHAAARTIGRAGRACRRQRLYRTLDELLSLKETLQVHLKQRMWEACSHWDYDILLYARHQHVLRRPGQFSDGPAGLLAAISRSDCKQVCIGLVVRRVVGCRWATKCFRETRPTSVPSKKSWNCTEWWREIQPHLGDGPGHGQREEP